VEAQSIPAFHAVAQHRDRRETRCIQGFVRLVPILPAQIALDQNQYVPQDSLKTDAISAFSKRLLLAEAVEEVL
jgi:hypothetical protein